MSATTAAGLSDLVSARRMRATRAYYLLFALCILLADSRHRGGLFADLLLVSGTALIGLATAGRLWCALFISGHKREELTREGPYSMTRNPLYFSSFLGFTGLGLAAGSLLLALVSALFFFLLYQFTIRQEERFLGARFGEDFVRYCASTPRFLPNPALYREPATWSVDPRQFRRTMLDAIWFVWGLAVIQLAAALHAHHLLPLLAQLP